MQLCFPGPYRTTWTLLMSILMPNAWMFYDEFTWSPPAHLVPACSQQHLLELLPFIIWISPTLHLSLRQLPMWTRRLPSPSIQRFQLVVQISHKAKGSSLPWPEPCYAGVLSSSWMRRQAASTLRLMPKSKLPSVRSSTTPCYSQVRT